MAGRGSDIVLGGNLEAELKALESLTPEEIAQRRKAWDERHTQVVNAGGLYVLGTERHESRRIDNQLRGRSGRQGDPGKSRFYLSLSDNLLRIFGGDKLNAIMKRIGMEKGAALESRMLSRSIENAQRKVEAYNFDVRKQLLEYDDVANEQRKVIYAQRDDLLNASSIGDTISDISVRVIDQMISAFIPPHSMEEEWNVAGLEQQLDSDFHLKLNVRQWLEQDTTMDEDKLRQRIQAEFKQFYQQKEAQITPDIMRQFEKAVMLQTLDVSWREHLAAMDYLRQGIHLRGYAQKNPKQEYKRESFELFSQLLDKVNYDVISGLSKFEVRTENAEQLEEQQRNNVRPLHMEYKHVERDALQDNDVITREDEQAFLADQTVVRDRPKVGRNDVCPCGSGKKYKQCHGKLD
jgi:preprotein translocase subunit SecA